MIRSIFISKDGNRQENIDPAKMHELMTDPADLLWVSLENPTPEEIDEVLNKVFQFHPLAVEDCMSSVTRPPRWMTSKVISS